MWTYSPMHSGSMTATNVKCIEHARDLKSMTWCTNEKIIEAWKIIRMYPMQVGNWDENVNGGGKKTFKIYKSMKNHYKKLRIEQSLHCLL